ncbi:MAG: hypothetical protein HY461_01125 [Parcubacteria group bacterium]|nr:hypothetical protein [Parcubacteria group bacterium]
MPLWIYLSISAYLLMALSQTIDKALLHVVFRHSRAYAALVGLLGLAAFLLLPWTSGALTPGLFLLCLVAGASFVAALVPFLAALQGDQATRIIPFVGTLVPLLTFFMEWLVLGQVFHRQDLAALAMLVSGAAILTFAKNSRRRSWSAMGKGALAAVMFAACFVLSKYIYVRAPFLDAFVWMRLGGIAVSVVLLLQAGVRQELVRVWRHNRKMLLGGYVGTHVISGTGFFLHSLAISLGTATLVSAMQGIQYVLLVLLVVIASRFHPEVLEEDTGSRALFTRLAAIAVIAAGLALLAL